MSQNANAASELFAIGARTSPGALVSMWTLNHLVAALTALFLVLQIAHFVWRWRREWKAKRPA